MDGSVKGKKCHDLDADGVKDGRGRQLRDHRHPLVGAQPRAAHLRRA
jgi:hypothetical protein